MVTGWTLAVILVVMTLAAVFQAAIGFGAALIAIPIIAQLRPDLVPGSVMMATLALNLMIMTRDRSAVELRSLSAAAVGAVAGSLIGAVVAAQVSDRVVQVLVACCVLAMVVLLVAVRAYPTPTVRNLVGAGTASGFALVTAGIGGPPIALLYSGGEGAEVRGSLSTFFVFTGAVALTSLALAGRLDGERFVAGLELMPAVVAGFVLGRPLTRVVDRGLTRPAILVVSTLSAVILLVRVALGG
jgi:uncharacterized membrane protein YfcA